MKDAPVKSVRCGVAVAQASRRWMAAGLAGMTICSAVGLSGVGRLLPTVPAALLAIASGWLVMLLLAPWRKMRGLHIDERPAIELLTRQLHSIVEGDRSAPLKDLILTRDDHLGRLSRAVHDLAAEAIRNRRDSRLLHRRMGDDVERETKRATAHLQRQAATDPLTGLGNRRVLERCFSEMFGPQAPSDRLLTVMAIDLDLFKDVNDTLGHEVGDRCLVVLADLLKSSLRREDCAIRLGGDEFVVLMPDQPIEIGKLVAERIGRMFSQMPWPYTKSPRPTLSFGLAWASIAERIDPSELLRRADAALYASKQSGRAAVTAFAEQRGAA